MHIPAFVQLQLSSAAQLYTINYMNKGSVAAYHLYLKIRELLSLSSRIPERYNVRQLIATCA